MKVYHVDTGEEIIGEDALKEYLLSRLSVAAADGAAAADASDAAHAARPRGIAIPTATWVAATVASAKATAKAVASDADAAAAAAALAATLEDPLKAKMTFIGAFCVSTLPLITKDIDSMPD